MNITFSELQIKHQESVISSDAGFAEKNAAIGMRRQLLEAEASTSRFYSCQTEEHLRPLLHLFLKFSPYMHPQGSLCILNHVKFIPEGIHSRNHVKSYSLRTCTKRQGKRERDEHKERPNMYVYAKPGREED